MIWIGAAGGALLLTAGLLVGHYVLPATADAAAPRAGLVTVPVRYGKLQNVVTLRGQVGFADSLDLTVDTSALNGTPIVTGHVPAVGAQLAALSVALEVSGRPVIVLPGTLAVYRTLKFGMSGADVVQFKQAMGGRPRRRGPREPGLRPDRGRRNPDSVCQGGLRSTAASRWR